MSKMSDFKGRHFSGQVILWAMRWYCKYGISYQIVYKMIACVNVDLLLKKQPKASPLDINY